MMNLALRHATTMLRRAAATTRSFHATAAPLKAAAYEIWFHKDVPFAKGETGVDAELVKESEAWHCAVQYDGGMDSNTWRIIKDRVELNSSGGKSFWLDRDNWVETKPPEFSRRALYEVDSYITQIYDDDERDYNPLLDTLTERAKWTMDEATSIEEMAEMLRGKADYLDGLAKGGYTLNGSCDDDYAFISPPDPLTIEVEEHDPALIS